jgi:hypothetical protein
MSMSLEQAHPTPKSFWRTWRREIIRGGVLFGLVIGAGLFLRSVGRNVKDNIHIPEALGTLGSFGDFNWGDGDGGDLFGHGRQVGDPWEYRTELKPSQHVWIRNTNGPIEVVAGEGNWLQVHAEKSWRNSSPGSVELVHLLTDRGVTICALWEARERRCGDDGSDYRMNGVKKNDVAVRFTVELPAGIPIEVSTVNGGLEIGGVSAPVEANTVNGRIAVRTSTGPVQATTVNGSIEAIMQNLTSGDVQLSTVNGSVTAGLPARINAKIDASTVNGRVESSFPITITGKVSKTHLRGTIGTGGPTVKLNTVNGSVSLHEADAGPYVHPTIAPRVRVHVRDEPSTPKAPRTPPPDRP